MANPKRKKGYDKEVPIRMTLEEHTAYTEFIKQLDATMPFANVTMSGYAHYALHEQMKRDREKFNLGGEANTNSSNKATD